MSRNICETLATLFAHFGHDTMSERRRIEGTLRDLYPAARREVNALVTALSCSHLPTLMNIPRGADPRLEIRRIANQLHGDFGIDFSLATWSAESWAVGFGVLKPDHVGRSFVCQGCGRPGYADSRWRGRTAICPNCRSLLAFSASLEAVLTESGAGKDVTPPGTEWTLLDDPRRDGTLQNHVDLQRAITQVLADGLLTNEDKSRILLLTRTCASLPADAPTCVAIGQSRGACIRHFRRSVLLSILSTLGANMRESHLRASEQLIPHLSGNDEIILGTIDLASFDIHDRRLVFTDIAMYFPQLIGDSPFEYARIHFCDFPSCDFRVSGKFGIDLGYNALKLDLSGCSLRRNDVLTILCIIKGFEARTRSEACEGPTHDSLAN